MEAAIPTVPAESVVDKKGDSNSGMLCDSDCWNHTDSKSPKQSISKRIRKICSDVKQTIFFWIAYFSFTLVEPILCARFPKGVYYRTQIAVLAVNTLLFIVEIAGSYKVVRENTESSKPPTLENWEINSVLYYAFLCVKRLPFLKFAIYCIFLSDGQHSLSFFCLLGGWSFIFNRPGIAVLRCFRVFRLLWLYDLEVLLENQNDNHWAFKFKNNEFVRRVNNVCRFSINSLTALGSEMFRLTNATRGGLFLMNVFFYFAFVFGAMFYVEVGEEDWWDGSSNTNHCTSMQMCIYTLMRLTFYDGTGLDFAAGLARNNHPNLFFLAMLFMCITAFGLLNGLIGIFGGVFVNASQEAFEKPMEKTVEPMETVSPPPALDAVSSAPPSHKQVTVPPTPNPMRTGALKDEGNEEGNNNILKNILHTIFLKNFLDADKELEAALKKRRLEKLRKRESQTRTIPQDEGMAIDSYTVSADEIIIEPALSNSFEESKSQSSPPSPLQLHSSPPSREDKIVAIKKTMLQLTQTMQALQAEIDALG